MKPVIVDSSVTVKWLNQIDEKLLGQADKLLSDAQVGSVNLLAPELSKYEIGNALLKKKLNLPMAYESLGTVYQLPLTFVPESEELAKQLSEQGLEVLYDDRELSAGEKFADRDLLGIPVSVIVSEKGLADNSVEIVNRRDKKSQRVSVSALSDHVANIR